MFIGVGQGICSPIYNSPTSLGRPCGRVIKFVHFPIALTLSFDHLNALSSVGSNFACGALVGDPLSSACECAMLLYCQNLLHFRVRPSLLICPSPIS